MDAVVGIFIGRWTKILGASLLIFVSHRGGFGDRRRRCSGSNTCLGLGLCGRDPCCLPLCIHGLDLISGHDLIPDLLHMRGRATDQRESASFSDRFLDPFNASTLLPIFPGIDIHLTDSISWRKCPVKEGHGCILGTDQPLLNSLMDPV